MKKTILFFASMMTLFVSSCSDMLEVEDKRHIAAEETIGSKTDSMYYAYGIIQAMQKAADMYVLQNEMRGDLVSTTPYSSTHLRDLANYTATPANKYDSAYVYYRVVNNCNNYIARRDTALYDGSYNVTTNEYAAVLAFRAWAYLQLARMYGNVKFYTHPLTSISQIESDKSPEYDINRIVNELAPELEKYSGLSVPSTDWYLFIPVDVILGEMYLECGKWLDAARHYYRYLLDNRLLVEDQVYSISYRYLDDLLWLPEDIPSFGSEQYVPFGIYKGGKIDKSQVISYISMASDYMRGPTTELPKLFGYDYYSTENNTVNQQIVPSDTYAEIAANSDYYYVSTIGSAYSYAKLGDMRRPNTLTPMYTGNGLESLYVPAAYAQLSGRTILYRPVTIWLHLAEALNRHGHPDAAFAILKDGISSDLNSETSSPYITQATRDLFSATGELPFFGEEAMAVFTTESKTRNYGIHAHGCSDNQGALRGTQSLYQMDTIVGVKLKAIEEEFGLSIMKTKTCSRTVEVGPAEPGVNPVKVAVANAIAEEVDEGWFKVKQTITSQTQNAPSNPTEVTVDFEIVIAPMADVINAMEDILCDEYAMEYPFEGSRFTDLTRMARHKNAAGLYGGNFGGLWLDKKLKKNNPAIVKDLTQEQNWYLPMK